jgi:hypothetical protein
MWPFKKKCGVAPRVRVTNSTKSELRAAVEPWGMDFPVAPEETIDFEAERASPDFQFDVHCEEGWVGVWYEGICLAVIVSLPDGTRERFSWEIPVRDGDTC